MKILIYSSAIFLFIATATVADTTDSNANFLKGYNENITKDICTSYDYRNCFGASKQNCNSMVKKYVYQCAQILKIQISPFPTRKELGDVGEKIGKCLFEQRIKSGIDMDKIDTQSCSRIPTPESAMQFFMKNNLNTVTYNTDRRLATDKSTWRLID